VEPASLSQLPWAVTRSEFERAAAEVEQDGAVCVFVIDDSIPKDARSGYAALVIAYARADEPVLILEDGGAALLIRDGGTAAGEVAARRVLNQMRRLALNRTLRAGVVSLAGDPDAAVRAARNAAENGSAGEVALQR
jgi:hypothetical protein